MHVLSLASDVSTLAPLRHETQETDSTANDVVESMPAKTPNNAATSTIPAVVLDTDVVSHNMAARLCITFLGHVLFLKNQVPFPIVQLAKMPMSDNTTRAAKKRYELLNSFDTLTSHLYTTFIALSTALALRGSPEEAGVGSEVALRHRPTHGVARVFLTFALGPTVGTAKSRVIVGIDGLETRVWGLREDDISDQAAQMGHASKEAEEDNTLGGASEAGDEEDEEGKGEECGDNSEEEEEACGSNDDACPPPSRSPSPASFPDSDSPRLASPPNPNSPLPSVRAEGPDIVRAAERLLSRTLANACAEDDGQGLASEMAPTQIHVLLRAPRRFDHPSWIPRQNLCHSLDSYLTDFLVESKQTPGSAPCETTTKKRTRASKIQGVWVKSRGGGTQADVSEQDLAEADELIWWSWDGKLTGFADW